MTQIICNVTSAFGYPLQDWIWTDYLTNIGAYWKSKGAMVGAVQRK